MIVTVDGSNRIIEQGHVVVKNGRIVSLGAGKPLTSQAEKKISAKGLIIIPGLICAHNHMYGVLSHGIPLQEAPSTFYGFLRDFWWPKIEDRLTKNMVKAATLVACVEMAKTGTTCFADILEAPHAIPNVLDVEAQVVQEAGLRGILSIEASERVSEENAKACTEENLSLIKKWNNADGLVKGMFCTHTLFTCSLDFLSSVRRLASEQGGGIHFHLEEGAYETQFCLEKYGAYPVEVYDRIGFLGPDVLASQCVHTKQPETDIFKKRDVKLAHMPLSNCEVGGGIAPLKSFVDAGLTVSLGTDGYVTDMFEVMRAAFLIHKGYLQDASAIPAELVLRMATVNGAKALGLDSQVGSLEQGKQADMVILQPEWPTPVTSKNVVSQLVAFGRGDHVKTTIVAGRIVVEERRILTLNETDAKKRCREAAMQLWSS